MSAQGTRYRVIWADYPGGKTELNLHELVCSGDGSLSGVGQREDGRLEEVFVAAPGSWVTFCKLAAIAPNESRLTAQEASDLARKAA